jgi:hypothetical protein
MRSGTHSLPPKAKNCGATCKNGELDIQNHGAGTALDEVNAHRFLESLSETLTVLAMREKLRRTGALGPTERPKLVPLTHYLLFKYDADWHVLVNSAGDNSEELRMAQQMLDEADRQARIARENEAPFKRAQLEVEAAVAEVKAQEDARNNKIAELQAKSTQGGAVSQNKAKNELAQVLAEDPLPLRKAKITLEAALKKAEKARAPFEAATRAAEEALDQASAYLEEVKKRPGSPHGRIWWMQREVEEQKKYLPTSRGGISRK